MSIPQCPPDGFAKKSVLRIFLVEGVPAVRELIVTSFAEIDGICWAGFADSENDAMEQLSQEKCDVLIVDLDLQQGNGMSLLRRLMQTNSQPDSLKIVFSNNVSDAYRRAGLQYGVNHFFDKSFELPQLQALLESLRQIPGSQLAEGR
jgi:DNA-binding NarL/FixJ family response regulator